jgi:hypothetical protein
MRAPRNLVQNQQIPVGWAVHPRQPGLRGALHVRRQVIFGRLVSHGSGLRRCPERRRQVASPSVVVNEINTAFVGPIQSTILVFADRSGSGERQVRDGLSQRCGHPAVASTTSQESTRAPSFAPLLSLKQCTDDYMQSHADPAPHRRSGRNATKLHSSGLPVTVAVPGVPIGPRPLRQRRPLPGHGLGPLLVAFQQHAPLTLQPDATAVACLRRLGT